MTFANSINSSNNDFELSSGTVQFANRTRLHGGDSENLGISYSGTTFTVRGGDGNAISATNPAYVNLQSLATPGNQLKFKLTANQSFTQAQLGNNLFGYTTAVNITVDVPFYLYAVSNANNGENAIAFMISRVPHRTSSPAAAKIAQSGNTNATTQGSMFSLSAITAADYASAPCLCIGSFRMRYAASLWTVQTLLVSDGIGLYQEGVQFQFPISQLGAATGKYFRDNGGTAPHDSAGSTGYYVYKNGTCRAKLVFPSITTGGVGAVTSQQMLPYVCDGNTIGTGLLASGGYAVTTNTGVTNQPYQTFFFTTDVTTGIVQNVNLGAGASVDNQSIFEILQT